MIIGLLLVGMSVGAGTALFVLIMGHSVWMALLIYAAAGVLSVLAGAVVLSLRAEPEDEAEPTTGPYSLPRPQRG